MAGYSGTPLVQKLGLKAGMRVHFIDAPRGYFEKTLGRTPTVVMMTKLKGPLDFVQAFCIERQALADRIGPIFDQLEQDGMLWVSWPKKSAGVTTDLTEDVVRGIALDYGVVDVKVCAIDDTWSGLKLVRRVKDRKAD